MKIVIINGPNLNLTGIRKPEIYGSATFQSLIGGLDNKFPNVEIMYFQSNSEGELIDAIHKYGVIKPVAGIVINPGALAHYSYALADALEASEVPVIEVHLSNIFARESHRRQSVTAPYCDALIAGCGMNGYVMAIEEIIRKAEFIA